jgi:hypothetical protein
MKPLFTVTLKQEFSHVISQIHPSCKSYQNFPVLEVHNGKFLIAYTTYNDETFFTHIDPQYCQLSSKLEGVLG